LAPQHQTVPELFHFDRDRLAALAGSRRKDYASAHPFPHTVVDGLVPDEVLDRVRAEFPPPQRAEWSGVDSPLERKQFTNDAYDMGEATRQFFAELNSAAFIEFLEQLTGIEGLVPDPRSGGGGLHQVERGGHLKVHADFNRHPRTGLERRLNVLVYLNRDWREEYGGALELWSRDMSSCDARIPPLFNRWVVFSTTDTSFHGHPEPLTCPEGETRKSMALYYYSKDRPAEERSDEHNTLFQARPGEELPRIAWGRGWRSRAKTALREITPPIVANAVRRRRNARRPR
jgi:Rps23 Pro-64 3,4-dihydroxylase Tpa1-like proline 4-hydroxylase